MRNLQNKKCANIFNFQELQQNLFLIILILTGYIFANYIYKFEMFFQKIQHETFNFCVP